MGKKDIASDPDAWYWDGPEDGSSLKSGPLASPQAQQFAENLTFQAFGQKGLDEFRASQNTPFGQGPGGKEAVEILRQGGIPLPRG
ncbi:MAG: hypothetical protein LBL45_07660 [Treponema sp.]|nr:hypothetical protein [Treponema sp.]